MSKVSVAKFNDFVAFLKAELSARVEKNFKYNQTQFAKDLGLKQSSLSEIFSRKHGVSVAKASGIAKRLKLNVSETRRLLDLVELQFARGTQSRAMAKQRIEARHLADLKEVNIDRLNDMGFYSFVLVEALKLKHQSGIGALPGFTAAQTRDLLQKLIDLGLIEEKDGKWQAVLQRYRTTDDTPSLPVKNFHRSLMRQAADAIMHQDISEREYRACVMAMPKNKVEEVKRRIKDFVSDVAAEYAAAEDCDSVYAFGVQFFDATPKNEVKMDC